MVIVPSRPHSLSDYYGCDAQCLEDCRGIGCLLGTAAKLDLTIAGRMFHRFFPCGVTGVLAIAESHLSVHAWVEYGHAAAGLFLCNSKPNAGSVEAAIADMAEFFRAGSRTASTIQRGLATSILDESGLQGCGPAPHEAGVRKGGEGLGWA